MAEKDSLPQQRQQKIGAQPELEYSPGADQRQRRGKVVGEGHVLGQEGIVNIPALRHGIRPIENILLIGEIGHAEHGIVKKKDKQKINRRQRPVQRGQPFPFVSFKSHFFHSSFRTGPGFPATAR